MAGRQRSRCDTEETWMPQAAASRTSSWPLSLPPPADYPGAPRAGYHSPSQFSREYRRLFSAPPGQDAERRHADTAPKTRRPHTTFGT